MLFFRFGLWLSLEELETHSVLGDVGRDECQGQLYMIQYTHGGIKRVPNTRVTKRQGTGPSLEYKAFLCWWSPVKRAILVPQRAITPEPRIDWF